MSLKVSSITDVGTTRLNNEDSFLILPELRDGKLSILAIVADGMGGHDRGEVASSMIKNEFVKWFKNDFPGINDGDTEARKLKMSLCNVIADVNRQVYEFAEENGIVSGSTLVGLLISNGIYFAWNVGDSRIYKFTATTNKQITKDQTVAQNEIDSGTMTKTEALKDKKSHVLTQCIGMEGDVIPDFFKGKYKEGDYFLICSDGMYNRMSMAEISRVIRSEGKLKDKLFTLAETAKEKGEKDNITGILIHNATEKKEKTFEEKFFDLT